MTERIGNEGRINAQQYEQAKDVEKQKKEEDYEKPINFSGASEPDYDASSDGFEKSTSGEDYEFVAEGGENNDYVPPEIANARIVDVQDNTVEKNTEDSVKDNESDVKTQPKVSPEEQKTISGEDSQKDKGLQADSNNNVISEKDTVEKSTEDSVKDNESDVKTQPKVSPEEQKTISGEDFQKDKGLQADSNNNTVSEPPQNNVNHNPLERLESVSNYWGRRAENAENAEDKAKFESYKQRAEKQLDNPEETLETRENQQHAILNNLERKIAQADTPEEKAKFEERLKWHQDELAEIQNILASDYVAEVQNDVSKTTENKTDENKVDENKVDENEVDKNEVDENKVDENKTDKNKIDENKADENKGTDGANQADSNKTEDKPQYTFNVPNAFENKPNFSLKIDGWKNEKYEELVNKPLGKDNALQANLSNPFGLNQTDSNKPASVTPQTNSTLQADSNKPVSDANQTGSKPKAGSNLQADSNKPADNKDGANAANNTLQADSNNAAAKKDSTNQPKSNEEQINELNTKLAAAKTPEEKAAIQKQIDTLNGVEKKDGANAANTNKLTGLQVTSEDLDRILSGYKNSGKTGLSKEQLKQAIINVGNGTATEWELHELGQIIANSDYLHTPYMNSLENWQRVDDARYARDEQLQKDIAKMDADLKKTPKNDPMYKQKDCYLKLTKEVEKQVNKYVKTKSGYVNPGLMLLNLAVPFLDVARYNNTNTSDEYRHFGNIASGVRAASSIISSPFLK